MSNKLKMILFSIITFITWIILSLFVVKIQSGLLNTIISSFYLNLSKNILDNFDNDIVLKNQDNFIKINFDFSTTKDNKSLLDLQNQIDNFLTFKNIFLVQVLDSNRRVIYVNNNHTIMNENEKFNTNIIDNIKSKIVDFAILHRFSLEENIKAEIKKSIFQDKNGNYNYGYFLEFNLNFYRQENKVLLGYLNLFFNITTLINNLILFSEYFIFSIAIIIIIFSFERIIFNRKNRNAIVLLENMLIDKEETLLINERKNILNSLLLGSICKQVFYYIKQIYEYSDNIRKEIYGEIKVKSYIVSAEEIFKSIQSIDGTFQNLQNFIQASSFKLPLDNSIFDVRKIVTYCYNMTKERLGDSSINISIDQKEESLLINADQKKLIQLLDNLLIMIIKFLRSGEEIKISAHTDSSKKLENVVIEIIVKADLNISNVFVVMKDFYHTGHHAEEIVNNEEAKTLLLTKYLVENMQGKFEITEHDKSAIAIKILFKRVFFD